MKILIIDDDSISRKILNAKLNKLGECTSVDGGREAIALYNKSLKEKEPFELLILDISMPHVNGLEVLKIIRGKEIKQKIPKAKRVKIIMVTSRMNKLTIKNCIQNGCNGYITKPVNSFLLFQNIKKLGFEIPETLLEKDTKSHKNTVEEIIKRFYKGEINLPVLPNIIQEVQDFLKSEDASIDGLVEIIEKDPVMTGKLISIANSPLYKGVDAVDNLNSGLVRLGLKVAQNTISTIANKSLFNSKNKSLKELLGKLWMHSFACACCGKLIAEELKLEDSETIFLMGIVHDIGIVLLLKVTVDIIPDETFEGKEIQMAIHEIHTTFGGVLLKKWKFAKEFIDIAEFHHWNTFPNKIEKKILIVSLANYLANEIGFDFFNTEENSDKKNNESTPTITELLKKLSIEKDQFIKIGEQAKIIITDSVKAF